MKGVQCYELFGGMALKNDPFFHHMLLKCVELELSQCVYDDCIVLYMYCV